MKVLFDNLNSNDEKITSILTETKTIIDGELLIFNNKIKKVENQVLRLSEQVEISSMKVNDNTQEVEVQANEIIRVKQQQDKLHSTTASKKLLMECIDKTQTMCTQFNFAVQDLRN